MRNRTLTQQRPNVDERITLDELRLATRNHSMPSEALRYPITPVGLHYTLIHYDIPDVDATAFRLAVDGHVDRPITLTLEELRSRPAVTLPVTLECAGNGRALLTPRPTSQPWLTEAVGTAAWTGTPLAPLLEAAGVRPDAVEVAFTGLDRGVEGGEEQDYARSLTLDEALRDDVLLAYDMNGEPLPPQHGFPVRLIVPGWYGMTHVKWLRQITVLAEPFHGYQQVRGYRLRGSAAEHGTPVTRMLPRSLVQPPGMPDFMSRARFLAPGQCVVHGRAWSGWGPITHVEVSTDGGLTWADARVETALAPYAWSAWSFPWDAAPGSYGLCSRATDAAGHVQPLHAPWNLGGYANNAIQHIQVTVR